MSYRFELQDETVQQGARRIAVEQIDKAIQEIDDSALDVHKTVHQIRKRCKKVRGLIRLVRGAFDGYREENAAFRDAARPLSYVRDSEALLETYDALVEAYEDQIDRPAFASVRRRLTLRQKEIADAHDLDRELADFRAEMTQAAKRARDWRIEAEGFAALAGGLGKTYARARKTMGAAESEGTAEAFHEWRKRIKYHWHHARLLAPSWPGPLKAHRDAADTLSDLLGDHHDLAVLREVVAADPDAFGSATSVEALFGLTRARQAVLETEAFHLGAKLLAEPKSALVHRWGRYWATWHEKERERPAVEAA